MKKKDGKKMRKEAYNIKKIRRKLKKYKILKRVRLISDTWSGGAFLIAFSAVIFPFMSYFTYYAR